jgi:hypothetical protein
MKIRSISTLVIMSINFAQASSYITNDGVSLIHEDESGTFSGFEITQDPGKEKEKKKSIPYSGTPINFGAGAGVRVQSGDIQSTGVQSSLMGNVWGRQGEQGMSEPLGGANGVVNFNFFNREGKTLNTAVDTYLNGFIGFSFNREDQTGKLGFYLGGVGQMSGSISNKSDQKNYLYTHIGPETGMHYAGEKLELTFGASVGIGNQNCVVRTPDNLDTVNFQTSLIGYAGIVRVRSEKVSANFFYVAYPEDEAGNKRIAKPHTLKTGEKTIDEKLTGPGEYSIRWKETALGTASRLRVELLWEIKEDLILAGDCTILDWSIGESTVSTTGRGFKNDYFSKANASGSEIQFIEPITLPGKKPAKEAHNNYFGLRLIQKF